MTSSQHLYEVRPRKDHRGVDLISDALSSASKVGTREGNSRVPALAVGIDAMTYGRGCGVGRGLGVAVALGIGVGVGAHGPGTTTATSSTNMLVKSPNPS